MAYDRIQAKGYKHICDRCECDAGGAQCKPFLERIYEEAKNYDMYYYWRYQYEPSCSIANGHLCHYYWNKYIKPRIKDNEVNLV